MLKEKHINSEEVDDVIRFLHRCKERKLSIRETAYEVRRLIDQEKQELIEKNERLGTALKELQAQKAQGSLL